MKPQQMIDILKTCDPRNHVYFITGYINDVCPEAKEVHVVENGQVLIYEEGSASHGYVRYFNTDEDMDSDSPEPQNAILIY